MGGEPINRIQPRTYVPVAEIVQAVLVTEDNMELVAAWCHGEYKPEGYEKASFAVVVVPLDGPGPDHFWIKPGDWLIFHPATREYTWCAGEVGIFQENSANLFRARYKEVVTSD
jgi:hypothetical protein